jgi:4-hydroxy-2-oxoheptanedioate aldolase
MRSNLVKTLLATKDKHILGTWLTLGDELSPRILSRSGFDFLVLDLEHAAIDCSRAASIFAHIADSDCIPLCRVTDGSIENIKRALDSGAFGIICPMVESLEQARAIIDAAYYPPLGRRSVGPGLHYLNFRTSDTEYKANANSLVSVILMVESPEGVASVHEWAALDGVDAVFIGPADLRAQMSRKLPNGRAPTEEEFEDMISVVQKACESVGCATGIHAFTSADARLRLSQGFRFITVGSDLTFLSTAAVNTIRDVSSP